MASDRQESGKTPARPIRVAQPLWDAFGRAVGTRERSRVLVEFMRWYVHDPHSKLPKRPDRAPPPAEEKPE